MVTLAPSRNIPAVSREPHTDAARLAVCHYATDADDAAELMRMLGIYPGQDEFLAHPAPLVRTCERDGCWGKHWAHGECLHHYNQTRRRSDKGIPPMPIRPVEERFWAATDITVDDCWLWRGPIRTDGYGLFWADGLLQRAHVWAYERFVGEIPEGLRLARRPGCPKHCVNYEHWTPKTNSQISAERHARRRANQP